MCLVSYTTQRVRARRTHPQSLCRPHMYTLRIHRCNFPGKDIVSYIITADISIRLRPFLEKYAVGHLRHTRKHLILGSSAS